MRSSTWSASTRAPSRPPAKTGFPGCEQRAARTKRGAAEQANVYRCLTPKFLDARLVTVLVGDHGGEAGQNEVERRPSGGSGEDSARRFSRHQVVGQLAKTSVNAALDDTRAQINPFGVALRRHAGVVEVVIARGILLLGGGRRGVREEHNAGDACAPPRQQSPRTQHLSTRRRV